jgi:hypothetical protein
VVMLVVLIVLSHTTCFAVVPHCSDSSYTQGIIPVSSVNVLLENVTNYYGDLIIKDHETLSVENCIFNITGKLVISDHAQAIINNCRFVLYWNETEKPDTPSQTDTANWRTRQIIVQNLSKLDITNSEIILLVPPAQRTSIHAIVAYDQANITMVNSSLTWADDAYGWAYNGIYLYDYSRLVIDNCNISTFQKPISPRSSEEWEYAKNFVFGNDSSHIFVTDSIVDRVYTGGNSSSILLNCTSEQLEASQGTPQVWLTNSTVTWIDSSSSSDIFLSLTNTKVKELDVRLGQVWLDGSEVKDLYAHQTNVLVIWHLPFFGQTLVPYSWVPYIVPGIILIIVTIFIVSILIVKRRRKLAKQSLGKPPNDISRQNCAVF